jgi:hypothetical protein
MANEEQKRKKEKKEKRDKNRFSLTGVHRCILVSINSIA